MNSLLRRPFRAVAAAAVTILLAACGSMPQQPAATTNSDDDIALYKGVIDRIHESYVDPVNDDKLTTNALKGMLNGLDPHSDYMTETEYQEMLDDNSGEFAGIGAELTREDGQPKVISPIDDTPAAHAGVLAGDVILKINGTLTDGLSLKDVVDLLRGSAGTKVVITIGRKDVKPFDVTLTRALIHVASVKWKLEPHHVGYARITSFAEKTQQELTAGIDDMKKQAGGKLDGFVLDLRNDPGGLLDEAVAVAGDYLDGGVVVSTKGRDTDDNHSYSAPSDGDRLQGVPVVVLINGASASASEIVAGALQDRHRATLMGTKSFGKGSVQTIIPLDGKGALRLTTALYYTPSGRSIQALGITPDEVVTEPKTQVEADAEILHEADLRGAFSNAKAKGAHVKPASDDKTAAAATAADEGTIDPTLIGTPQDFQLAQALAQLRAMNDRSLARTQAPAPAGR